MRPNGCSSSAATCPLSLHSTRSLVDGMLPRTRLHALWTLDGLDALPAALVVRALDDVSADVRKSAVRLSERWLALGDATMTTAVTARVDDASPEVRRQVAASLGEVPAGPREELLATMVGRYGDDPVVMDASLSGMGAGGLALMDALRARKLETPLRRAALTMVAATLTRAADERPVQQLLSTVADPLTPAWQRDALLGGVEVALLNTPMPGSSGRRGGGPSADAPCTTCPGGRAGPGGAPAFPTAPASTSTGRGNDGPRLRLAARPAIADSQAAAAHRAGRATLSGSRTSRVAGQGRRSGCCGVDARGTGTVRRGQGSVRRAMSGLPSAGWPRFGQSRSADRRLGASSTARSKRSRACS